MKKVASIRVARRERQWKQNTLLNQLRIAYFLSPEKLKADNVTADNILLDGNIEALLKRMGLPNDAIGHEELYVYIVQQEFLLNTLYPSIADTQRMTSQEKKKLIQERKIQWSKHWFKPETMYVLAKNKNPKAINLKKFVEKIIAYQSFELKKLGSDGIEKKQKTYLEILQQEVVRGVRGYEASCVRSGIKIAKQNEKILRKNPEYVRSGITDKDIALAMYKNASKKNLQRVRQDRKRLRAYHFI